MLSFLLIGTNGVLFAYANTDGSHTLLGLLAVTIIDATLIVGFALTARSALLPLLGRPAWTARGLVLSIGLFAVFALVMEAYIWGAQFLVPVLDCLEPFREYGWPMWSAFVLIAVCPALFEELAFRGYLLGRFESVMGARDALILQAMLFAILHMSLLMLPPLFLGGLLLGLLRRRTGSLLPGIAMHFVWNSWVITDEWLARA